MRREGASEREGAAGRKERGSGGTSHRFRVRWRRRAAGGRREVRLRSRERRARLGERIRQPRRLALQQHSQSLYKCGTGRRRFCKVTS